MTVLQLMFPVHTRLKASELMTLLKFCGEDTGVGEGSGGCNVCRPTVVKPSLVAGDPQTAQQCRCMGYSC